MISSQSDLEAIVNSLSASRMQTYLNHTPNQDLQASLRLYVWNVQVSGALLLPLQVCEVVVRNAIAKVLHQKYGDWVLHQGFLNSLPNPKHGYSQRKQLQKAVKSATRHHRLLSIANVIPELNFVFWEALLTQRHDLPLWNAHLYTAFPNLDDKYSVQFYRKQVHDDLDDIRRLRNRIAHHEPLLKWQIQQTYDKMIRVIGYCCEPTAHWLAS